MQNIAISYFFTITIYWSSTRNIYLFCWYNIHNKYNFITFSYWSISNNFEILTVLTNTCARISTIILFAVTIIFTFTLTCFLILPLIWITCCTIKFAFAITWNMFCHCFSFIFVCFHIKCFNICVFCFFWNTYFWR